MGKRGTYLGGSTIVHVSRWPKPAKTPAKAGAAKLCTRLLRPKELLPRVATREELLATLHQAPPSVKRRLRHLTREAAAIKREERRLREQAAASSPPPQRPKA